MMTTTTTKRSALLFCLTAAMTLAACADPPELGMAEEDLLYEDINPTPHSEKAYQRGDAEPPLAAQPTTVDRSGTIVALVTAIYNRPPFGAVAQFSICDRNGLALYSLEAPIPGRLDVAGLTPGTEVYVRPETMGTMVKLLTPEQIASAQPDR
jgi:hypothetical protein